MIHSRQLILNEKLRILVDSETINGFVGSEARNFNLVLDYRVLKCFEFIRTPAKTENDILKDIPEYIEHYDENKELSAIEINVGHYHSSRLFDYKIQDIEAVGKHLLSRKTISKKELQELTLVFVQTVLQEESLTSILITEKKILLQNREWFESHFPGRYINILTVNEAKEVIDLFLKYQKKYHILPSYTCDKGYFYLVSFRSKVPNFHFTNQALHTFATRFMYFLMTIDEIGFRYYSEPNNDSLDEMTYYFNYLVSLSTGIFDSLAFETNDKFGLGFRASTKLSLNPSAGKDFLKSIGHKEPNLKKHINDFVYFIRLIYELRELVVHREMLSKIGFQSSSPGNRARTNFLRLPKSVAERIKQCKDKNPKYEFVTKWGLHKVANYYFLEPFHFAKTAGETLVTFSNKYLEILGYSNYVEDSNTNKEFANAIKLFKENKLGF